MADDALNLRFKALSDDLSQSKKIQQFIAENNAKSDELRQKWLFYLAKKKDYISFINHYKEMENRSLQCELLIAHIHIGDKNKAIAYTEDFWLKLENPPKSCQRLFALWQQKKETVVLDESWQSFENAMHHSQFKKARELKAAMSEEDRKSASTYFRLRSRPRLLRHLSLDKYTNPGGLISYGLSIWVKKDTDSAIDFWHDVKKRYPLTKRQKQYFFRKLALYKAMRNEMGADTWFAKLDVNTTPKLYLEWRIRYALKQERWQHVNQLIAQLPQNLQDKPCWQYWYARSFDKLNLKVKAKEIYQKLSEERHYYGFLASYHGKVKMNMQHDLYLDNDSLIEPFKEEIDEINQLYKDKKTKAASRLTYRLLKRLTPDERYQLAREYADWDWHEKALMLANIKEYRNDLRLRFPLAHYDLVKKYSNKYDIDKHFIYAVIRQESTFRKAVKSHAGALGLMQVIPSTARKMARKHKIKLRHMKQMYVPKTNVHIGTAYLKHLAKQFNGHPMLMAAAYNAGPNQVRYWLRNHPKHQSDIWIETLPWHETRNYLKNIVSFYAVYQYRLNKKPSIKAFMREI